MLAVEPNVYDNPSARFWCINMPITHLGRLVP
jgi:hypothetical protein